MLLGGALCVIVIATLAASLWWLRAETDFALPATTQSARGEFGSGVLTTGRSPRSVVVPGQAVHVLLGTRSILDTSVSAFTRGSALAVAGEVLPNARLIGEAQFDVALDSRRWYSVRVADVLVATTGARFNIRLDLGHPSTTSVAVEDGVVLLRSTARKADFARGSADSTQVYELSAGNVAWWNDSLPPAVVRSVDIKRYRGKSDSSE